MKLKSDVKRSALGFNLLFSKDSGITGALWVFYGAWERVLNSNIILDY